MQIIFCIIFIFEARFCGHPGDAQFADFYLEKGHAVFKSVCHSLDLFSFNRICYSSQAKPRDSCEKYCPGEWGPRGSNLWQCGLI